MIYANDIAYEEGCYDGAFANAVQFSHSDQAQDGRYGGHGYVYCDFHFIIRLVQDIGYGPVEGIAWEHGYVADEF